MEQHELSRRSEKRLVGVHPDIIKVLQRGLKLSPYDFGVLPDAVRTDGRQLEIFNAGGSTTLISYHLIQADGYSHAVDIYILVDGKVSWERRHYRPVIQALFTVAIKLGVQIEAGGLWQDFMGKDGTDSMHIQLNKKYYPRGAA